jgi:hypothetical protein
MLSYVTHFNQSYLSRGLALIESMDEDDKLVVFCHDEKSLTVVKSLNLKRIEALSLSVLEKEYPELISAKLTRSSLEYFFLLSPYIIKFLIEKRLVQLAIYVDADVFFFKKPERIVEMLNEDADVAITPHRFSLRDKYMEKYGKFNVGWVAFRKSEYGLKILDFWANSCLESTSMIPTDTSFGDQKYLDYFEGLGGCVQIIDNSGVNLAPWNTISVKPQETGLFHEGEELILFHFSGLKRFPFFASIGFAGYSKTPSGLIKKRIYGDYLKKLIYYERMYDCPNVQAYSIFNKHAWIREIFYRDLKLAFNISKNI